MGDSFPRPCIREGRLSLRRRPRDTRDLQGVNECHVDHFRINRAAQTRMRWIEVSARSNGSCWGLRQGVTVAVAIEPHEAAQVLHCVYLVCLASKYGCTRCQLVAFLCAMLLHCCRITAKVVHIWKERH